MHVGIGGAGGEEGRSYRSSISESHTAVPAPLPLPALSGTPGARLGACPRFGMQCLMLCPGNCPGSCRAIGSSAIPALCAAPSMQARSSLPAIRCVRNGVGPFSPRSKGLSSQALQDHEEDLWNSNSSAPCAHQPSCKPHTSVPL